MSELWQPWENLFLHEVGRTMPVHVIAEKRAFRIGNHSPGITYRRTTHQKDDRQTMDTSRASSLWSVLRGRDSQGNQSNHLLSQKQA